MVHSDQRWGAIEIVQGIYLAHFMACLEQTGALEHLLEPQTVKGLAKTMGWKEEPLFAGLELVLKTTDILVKEQKRYRLRHKYHEYHELRFHIRKLIIAGFPFLRGMEVALHKRASNFSVNDRDFAEAFAGFQRQPPKPSPGSTVIAAMGVRKLFDVGCGTGDLLVDLTIRKINQRGWGLDKSPWMCRFARRRITELGLADRLKIIHGDVSNLNELVTRSIRRETEAVHASGLLNQFPSPVPVLRGMRRCFPERVLIVHDYYGKLLKPCDPERYRHSLVHDFMQAMTGQTVPPSDRRAWKASYDQAGCTLIKSYDGESDGVHWFYDIVQM